MVRGLLFMFTVLVTGSVNPGIHSESGLEETPVMPVSDVALPTSPLPHVIALKY